MQQHDPGPHTEPHRAGRRPAPVDRTPCFVSASPELRGRLDDAMNRLRSEVDAPLAAHLGFAPLPQPLGFDDGVIIPPDRFPFGTPAGAISAAAADRAPLTGTVRVIVVLVDFSDANMAATQAHFRDLFFSTGVLPNGSVREYFAEVTGGLIDLAGDVVGPLRMPQTLAWYTNGNFGIGRPTGTTRARDLARDAVAAADPTVDFAPYDNDGNGFVDAFVVVHAGRGGEETGDPGHIWSHKWVLPGEHTTDNTKLFAYLTIPEDARIGVCAHELGHLLFGFPDLYDTDDTSEGIGNWCLMGGGSWNGGGDVPAHPSAFCKVDQGWATVTNVTANGTVSFPDVKTSRNVVRLWKDGAGGSEYFLVENRQRTGFDAQLPGDGLLIWHVDESQPNNRDENHYRVALVQADGQRHLELKANRGDTGDPFPGSAGNTAFSHTSTPSSDSYAGQDTCVSVTGISAPGATMSAAVTVRCGKGPLKDTKEPFKDRKDAKEPFKEIKEPFKEHKEPFKEVKEFKEGKELKEPFKEGKEFKELKEFKEPFKDNKEFERPGGGGDPFGAGGGAPSAGLPAGFAEEVLARLAALEQLVGGAAAQPFIGAELRPDLIGGPVYPGQQGQPGAPRDAKRQLDTPQQ